MEFGFRTAELFPAQISVVGDDLIPPNCPSLQRLGPKGVQQYMSEILDKMGRASAAAQNLHQIITSSDKLRQSNGEQRVYFFNDFESNQVIGLLKIGKKKLFVFDRMGVQHEMNPMCILDFYVHESRQRLGLGKILFEHMLAAEGVSVCHLAIDKPSDKFLHFFKKHYGLFQIIPQVNNFVIFEGFFDKRTDYAGKKARWGGLDQEENYERKKSGNVTRLQDSKSYNDEPALHLRGAQNGQAGRRDHVPQRHASSIGHVLHPPQQGMGNGNASSHWNNMGNDEGNYEKIFARRDLKFFNHRLW